MTTPNNITPTTSFEALAATVNALAEKTYTSALKSDVDAAVAAITAHLDTNASIPKSEKVQCLVLRARAALIPNAYSAEAENDLNKALRLVPTPTTAEPFLVLSECLWRKAQEQEAVDAAQSALRIEPQHVGVLCQLSRLLRSLASKALADDNNNNSFGGNVSSSKSGATTPQSGPANSNSATATSAMKPMSLGESGATTNTTKNNTAIQAPSPAAIYRTSLLQQSLDRAKEALSIDTTSGEAWAVYGLALFQLAVDAGGDISLVKKASAALGQAAAKNPTDPDVQFNRAVALESIGQYGQAAASYATAGKIDAVGLGRVAAAKIKECLGVIEAFSRVQQELKSIMEGPKGGPMKKELLLKLPQRCDQRAIGAQSSVYLSDLLADATNGARYAIPSSSSPAAAGTTISPAGEATKAGAVLTLSVTTQVSPDANHPVVLHCVDREGSGCLVLFYGVKPSAFLALKNKKGVASTIVLSIPFPFANHTVSVLTHPSFVAGGTAGAAAANVVVQIPTVTAEPHQVLLNGAPIPADQFTHTGMSSRLFQ